MCVGTFQLDIFDAYVKTFTSRFYIYIYAMVLIADDYLCRNAVVIVYENPRANEKQKKITHKSR